MLQTEIRLLKEWMVYCDIQCKCHELSRTYFSILNLCLSIPAIGLSTIAGSGNIGVGSNDQCNNSSSWLSIFFGVLGLISASLFTIHRTMGLPELQKQHDFYACEFQKLSNEIKMQLILDRKEEYHTYKNIAEFVKECKKTLDNLIDRSPIIPDTIIRKVNKTVPPAKGVIEIICKDEDESNQNVVAHSIAVDNSDRSD